MSSQTPTDIIAYDSTIPQEWVAEERGQIAIYPKENELFIDIDSEEQLKEFYRRAFHLGISLEDIKVTSSKTEGHKHITITTQKTFTDLERIAWQAALNDDPLKVFLSVMRVHVGIQNPTTFFENKPQSPQ
jgi:hypothetical protein